MNESGFYLVSFEISGVEVPLFGANRAAKGPKASIIIGPNGSGKSRVLSLLVDEFENLSRLLENEKNSQHSELKILEHRVDSVLQNEIDFGSVGREIDSKIEYFMDGDLWGAVRSGRDLWVTKNNKKITVSQLPIPDKLLAVAHLPVDRFRFSLNDSDDFYSYLGLRQSSNMTTTGALEKKVILSLLRLVEKGKGAKLLRTWLPELGLDQPVVIEIDVFSKHFYGISSYDEFVGLIEERVAGVRGRARGLNEDSAEEIREKIKRFWPLWAEFLPLINQAALRDSKKSTIIELEVGVDGIDGFEKYAHIDEFIDLGRRLRVFRRYDLFLYKKNKKVKFTDLSSGEQQVIGTITRLLENLGTTSLVVIDEPEVSLHPAWQKLYVPRLLETLEDYPNSHVVIATHSHFLVSDVSPDKGSLTVASGGDAPEFSTFDGEVYGRSAENILYRVFGIGAVGNFYVERDLSKALKMLSGVEDVCHDELVSIHQRLLLVDGQDNEPLKEIVDEVGAYLEGARSD